MRVILLGPTAVGKTDLSIQLARRLNAEIISVDSRQCYRYMNIGTAKPTLQELAEVKHYNISILDPDQQDSAAKFYERTVGWEREIRDREKTPLFVGGSTLHLQFVTQPFDDLPPADRENVRKLESRISREGLEKVYETLEKVDPEYTDQMDGMNPQRIIRALDVWMQTGKPFSTFHTEKKEDRLRPGTVVFGLKRKRDLLYHRINRRVDRMFERGLILEVQSILNRGFRPEDPGLNTVGYKEVIAHLQGEISREQMVEDIKTQTRRYAKRQLTWFRRWDFIHWIDLEERSRDEAVELIMKQLAAKSNKD